MRSQRTLRVHQEFDRQRPDSNERSSGPPLDLSLALLDLRPQRLSHQEEEDQRQDEADVEERHEIHMPQSVNFRPSRRRSSSRRTVGAPRSPANAVIAARTSSEFLTSTNIAARKALHRPMAPIVSRILSLNSRKSSTFESMSAVRRLSPVSGILGLFRRSGPSYTIVSPDQRGSRRTKSTEPSPHYSRHGYHGTRYSSHRLSLHAPS